MALRVVAYLVWQWLPILAVIVLLGVAFGWSVTALIALGLLTFVGFAVVARHRGRDLSRLAWPTLFGLMFAALGAAIGGIGPAAIAGTFGVVIGAISEIPLRKRSGELYTDGELARIGGLFLASLGILLFAVLVIATIAKAT
jgi:hypothetical protein